MAKHEINIELRADGSKVVNEFCDTDGDHPRIADAYGGSQLPFGLLVD